MLLIAAGVLHISAAADHTNLPVMLAGFLVVAALQAGLGGLLLFRRTGRLVLAGGLALTVGALATWLVSRTAGLPFLPGGHMEPIGVKDGVTVLFEAGTVPLLGMLASAELDQVRLPSPRLGSQAVAVLGSGIFALFVPALVLGGGEHHSHSEMAHAHGEEAHAHSDGEELADAHTHADRSTHAAGGHEHGGGHMHGQPATADALAAAHEHATGTTHSHADLGLTGGDGPAHQHSAGDDGHTHAGGEDGHDHALEQGGGHDKPGGHDHSKAGDQDMDHEHGSDEHSSDEHAEPAADNERALALESGHPAEDGRPAQGPALVYHDQANEEMNGPGHGHEPCQPTAEQQSAADGIVADVSAELKQYENNPAEALADGFNYVFGPTDRMLHMVSVPRIDDADVLKATEIESFIYYMTDTGFVPIGGMFVMPRGATSGPQPGGCLTQWHQHGGVIGRWATAGTSGETPLMMHVFTYPGLDPWGHYNGRDLAPLWTPGRWVPSVCRSADDANNGCLP
jgi:hypothetical protein